MPSKLNVRRHRSHARDIVLPMLPMDASGHERQVSEPKTASASAVTIDTPAQLNAPTAVDLFCGAGGLSTGLRNAGFRVVRAVDHFDAAVKTYRRNVGDHVEKTEIHEAMELPPATIITGGPPCQGFSSAGLRRSGDKRNNLVSVFAELIARHRPAAFIFENVEGFLTAESGSRVLDLLGPLVAAGYRIHLRKINAANFGVAQHRKRVLGIGGLGWDPTFPAPTHRAFGAPGVHRVGVDLPPTPTVLDALAGLGPPTAKSPGSPTGHFAVSLDADDLARVSALREGQTMQDLPETLWHESYKRRAFRRVMDGTPADRRGGAPCGIRRLVGEQPCKAITSGARSEFVHPTENRYLTMREAARIQGFLDDFEFIGRQSDIALLIGNAVPPLLGEMVGRQLAEDLRTAKLGEKPGALLSFVPTSAGGMSPAMERTVNLVRERFAPSDIKRNKNAEAQAEWRF